MREISILKALAERPGQWARLSDVGSLDKARQTAHKISNKAHPWGIGVLGDCTFDALSEREGDESVIYARLSGGEPIFEAKSVQPAELEWVGPARVRWCVLLEKQLKARPRQWAYLGRTSASSARNLRRKYGNTMSADHHEIHLVPSADGMSDVYARWVGKADMFAVGDWEHVSDVRWLDEHDELPQGYRPPLQPRFDWEAVARALNQKPGAWMLLATGLPLKDARQIRSSASARRGPTALLGAHVDAVVGGEADQREVWVRLVGGRVNVNHDGPVADMRPGNPDIGPRWKQRMKQLRTKPDKWARIGSGRETQVAAAAAHWRERLGKDVELLVRRTDIHIYENRAPEEEVLPPGEAVMYGKWLGDADTSWEWGIDIAWLPGPCQPPAKIAPSGSNPDARD